MPSKDVDQPISAVTPLLWRHTPVPPDPNSFVTAYFGGLCGFAYNSLDPNPYCDVGFHRGGGKHNLEISIYERPGCDPVLQLPNPFFDMTLEVLSKPSDVAFYEDPSFKRPDAGDPRDFRWLLDLDSDDFYPENVPKHASAFARKLAVRHGTFYTFSRSVSRFVKVDVNNLSLPHVPLGPVARYMAVAVNPQPSETVSLKIAGIPVFDFPRKPGVTSYEIHFSNECWDGNQLCHFTTNDPHEQNRNDFHFMRKVLRLPSGRTRYGLYFDTKPPGQSPKPPCPQRTAKFTDEAPCMGTGFGQTNGLP